MLRDVAQAKFGIRKWLSIKQKRNLLLAAVEQVDEAVVLTDTEGIIQYVNPAWERLTGYDGAEATGQSLDIGKSDKHHESYYDQMWDTITQGGVWRGRIIKKNKDGTLYDVKATISPFTNSSGRIVGYIACERDISKELALEEQLQHPHKLEAIGRLAGGVAHDFNNILTVISGNIQLALRKLEEEDPIYERLQMVRRAANHAEELTNKLLAFGRKQVVAPQVLHLNEVISSLMPVLRRMIGENIELVVQLGVNLGPVRIDPGQIEQVLVNLIVNACEAMPEGGTLIIETAEVTLDKDYVQTRPYVTPGQYAMISVYDTGCGMSEEIQSRIFEPFYSKKVGGTGLGLATVYGIAKQNKGSVEVKSKEGHGTTFWLYLPVVDAPIVTYIKEEKREDLPRGSETILLTEDSEEVRSFAAEVLRELGYSVHDFPDAEEAMKFSKRFKGTIDLLLTDVVMTGESGFDLAKHLNARRPSIRLLFMSGHLSDEIARHGVLDEGIDLLRKPFTATGLATRVREVLDR